MNPWSLAQQVGPTVQIQRFASSTRPVDLVSSRGIPDEIKSVVKDFPSRVAKIWRARIGARERWSYAWAPEEALRKALNAAGYACE